MMLYDIFIVRFPSLMLLIDLVFIFLIWKAFEKRDFLRDAYLFLNQKKWGSYQTTKSGITEQYFIDSLQKCRIARIRNSLGVIYELPFFIGISSLKNVGMVFVLTPAAILLFWGYSIENETDISYFIPLVFLSVAILGLCTHHLFKFKFFCPQSRKEKPRVVISASLVIVAFLCVYILGLLYFTLLISPYMPEISYEGDMFKFSCPVNYTIVLLPLTLYPFFGTLSLVARIISPRYQIFIELGAFTLCGFGFLTLSFSELKFPDITQFIYWAPVFWISFFVLLNWYYSFSDIAAQGEKEKLS
jgi:hypothetical protein